MTCPICDKPSLSRYRPFCSKRCADIDLARWLSGSYRVPSEDIEELEEALEEAMRGTGDEPAKPH